MDTYALVPSLPDEDLVRLWRGGEEDAFSQLYRRYRLPVLSTAYRIMRNPEEAQDATQEIFLKVYRSLPQWDPAKSRLSTWLFRLASNHAIDRWRLRHRRQRLESTTVISDPVKPLCAATDPAGPHAMLMRKEVALQIRRSIQALPRLQRRFFVLRYFQGLRLHEIALLEGRTIGTVKGLLFRACRIVRRRLSRR